MLWCRAGKPQACQHRAEPSKPTVSVPRHAANPVWEKVQQEAQGLLGLHALHQDLWAVRLAWACKSWGVKPRLGQCSGVRAEGANLFSKVCNHSPCAILEHPSWVCRLAVICLTCAEWALQEGLQSSWSWWRGHASLFAEDACRGPQGVPTSPPEPLRIKVVFPHELRALTLWFGGCTWAWGKGLGKLGGLVALIWQCGLLPLQLACLVSWWPLALPRRGSHGGASRPRVGWPQRGWPSSGRAKDSLGVKWWKLFLVMGFRG